MDFTLVSGRFTAQESEALLAKLVKVKTDFHLSKIDTVNQSEEDIKHSEKRIKELEEHMRKAVDLIRNHDHVALRATLSIQYMPDYKVG
jgi:Icc-related predicted phosphoesterase